MAGAVPLYGTVVISTFSSLWNSSPHRCDAEPMPALPRLTLPAFLPIQSRSSLKLLASSCGLPMTVMGTSLIMPRYSKSVS